MPIVPKLEPVAKEMTYDEGGEVDAGRAQAGRSRPACGAASDEGRRAGRLDDAAQGPRQRQHDDRFDDLLHAFDYGAHGRVQIQDLLRE